MGGRGGGGGVKIIRRIVITFLGVETTPNPEWYKGAQHSTNLPLAKQGQTRIKANSKLPSTFQNLEFILALSERF